MTLEQTDLAVLNDRWAVEGLLHFESGAGDLPRAVLTTAAGDIAHVYLHGAHISHYQPAGCEPVLFTSKRSQFAPGQPIRGGIPICFPWFGPHPDNGNLPPHGFARILPWAVQSTAPSEDGVPRIEMVLRDDERTRQWWSQPFEATMTVILDHQLTMAMQVSNPADRNEQRMHFEQALHTYLAVGDVRQVRIAGLAGATYIDKVDGGQRKREGDAPIRIEGETDRVYLDTESTCIIEDASLERNVLIAKRGSRSTVVWNPWIEKSRRMEDFGDDEWPGMLCIETANAADNAITLEPGGRHEISTAIRIASH